MSRRKTKITDRLLAMLLAVMMVVALFPTNLFPVKAATEEDTEFFAVTVTDDNAENASVIKDAKVILSYEADGWDKDLDAKTDENGIAKFSVEEVAKALVDGTGTIKYTVIAPGYFTVTRDENIEADALEKNVAVQMTKGDDNNSFEVSVKDQKNQPLSGADVVLSAKEDTWNLDMIAITDENGIAWFDKSYIAGVLDAVEGDGDKTIVSTVALDGYVMEADVETVMGSDEAWTSTEVRMRKDLNRWFEIAVKEGGNSKAGVEVVLFSKETDMILNLSAITDEDGVASFKKSLIENVLIKAEREIADIGYLIKANGYYVVSGEREINILSSTWDNVEESIVTIDVNNSVKVTVKDQKDQNLIQDAKVVLKNEEGTWELIALTDENGIAWFDKSDVASKFTTEEKKTILYEISYAGYNDRKGSFDITNDESWADVNVPVYKIGEDAFKVLVKEGEEVIKDAYVALKIKDANEWAANTTTGEDGIALFSAETIESLLGGSQSGTLEYAVSINDYWTKTGEFTVSLANLTEVEDVQLVKQIENTLDVDIKAGQAEVLFNGNEIDDNSITVTNEISDGLKVNVKITPEEKGYIKSLVIKRDGQEDEVIQITKGQPYVADIEVTEDTIIEVEVVKEYSITINNNSEQGNVQVLLEDVQDKPSAPSAVDDGTNVSVHVTAKEGYQISSIAITKGENVDNIEINDSTKHAYNSASISVTEDIVVSVTYVKIYEITVEYNQENGQVSIDKKVTEGGSVIVNGTGIIVEDGKSITIIADPNDNYRVSEFIIDGESENITQENYDSNKVYSKTINPTASFTVKITFAPNRYNVSKDSTYNGSITLNNNNELQKVVVNHGDSCEVRVSPNSEYMISKIYVDNAEYTNVQKDGNDGSVVFTLSNIAKDTKIRATFRQKNAVELNITELFNDEEAINVYGQTFVYKNTYDEDDGIRFVTDQNGIRITYIDSNGREITTPSGYEMEKELILKGSIQIVKIEINLDGDYSWNWHNIQDISTEYHMGIISKLNPLNIIVDNEIGNVEITSDEKHSNNFYNDDFNVKINITDEFSGINKIEYFVTDIEVAREADVKQYDSMIANNTQQAVLYEYDQQNKEQSKEAEFTVEVDENTNNSDYVCVWFKITDRAGNVYYVKSGPYMVNCTAPVLNSIDMINVAEQIPEKTGSNYNVDRKVTIVITDRASAFNSNGVILITKNGEPINCSSMIEWTSNGDVHTAVITFSDSGKYEWSLNYENLAGGTIKNTVTPVGDDVYAFTIDKDSPTGIISFDIENTWDNILSTLTFGFWKNTDITATVEPKDTLSGVNKVYYYKYTIGAEGINTNEIELKKELEDLYREGKFVSDPITVNAEEKFVIFARISDNAGNIKYISTNGAMFEITKSVITLDAESDPNEHGFYNGDVIVNLSVIDNVEGHLASGIKKISYTITSSGKTTVERTLYEYSSDMDLIYEWNEESIKVIAAENNSDEVVVLVTVEDNAGNINTKELKLKINVDDVKATLTMDGVANKVIDEHGYFKVDKRTATITVIDRLSAFDSNIATDAVNITAVDKDENEISNAYEISDWESKDGKHTATVTFNSNAIYTWSFDYTNKADNTLLANNFDIEDVQTPFSFTIDNVAPNGVVKVNDNAWDKLLNVLTFGYYDKVKAEVSAEASDNISPFIIEYYKTSNVNPMTESELEDVEFKPYAPFSVSGNEQFVVYVKISDYAGNCTYISSAGHVIDEAKSTITLTQSQTDALYNASDDVKVNVLVEDAEPYSGIKLVEYWIVNNGVKTQGEVIYTFDETNPTYDKLMKTWTGVITVDKSKNNSNDIEVYVRTVDNANNEETKSTKLAIDTVKPSISVKFDNGNDNNGNTYFDDKRVATVVITERAEQFDKVAATKGILVNAVDAEGNKVNDAYTIGDWTTSVNVENPDASTHTATITFAKDANYTWSISYTDKAGNTNSAVTTSVVNGTSVAAFDFTVDTVAPTGTLQAVSAEGKKAEWNALRPNLTFGFVSKGKITVSGTFDDVTSASAYKIEYYKVKATAAKDGTTALTEKDLNAVKNWTSLITKQQTNEFGKYYSFGDVVASKDEQFVVYVKLTDLAGNVKYLSTNGLIVDHTAPSEETLAPEVTMTQKAPVNGVYKDDVSVEIKVVDPLIGGTYSGLESVTYKVLNMGKETQTGELFAFKIQDPKQSELAQTWTGKIVVNSELNNSNNVQVVVYATDKAGNQSSKTLALKIDTTAPVIDIEYNNNNGETSYAGETLFKEDRVATIKVTERNFNGSKVVINVTNTDGSKPVLSNWTVFKNGTGNGDDTVYMATLTYSADGDYKFDIKYTDEAENVCTDIDYGQALAPTEFTIDKTLPTIQVSYDNNNVSNGNYYNQDRTATVTVTEHNFDPSRYVLTITATDNGVVAQIPTAGQWTSNGDVHRMTIPFTKDAHYTIDIEFTDKAGNMASDFVAQNFFIDKTNPTLSISGVTNESANNAGEVGLVITATDTNMDVFEPDIYAVIVTDDSYDTEHFNIGKRQNITNGIKYTVSNLEKDGMYKVECNVVDKAGNVYSEVLLYKSDDTSYTEQKTVGDVLLTFSVNREGSVYDVNDVTEQLIKDTYVQSISDDLAIVEVNADELVEYQVILNGKALTEDVDFTVVKEGGNGQWYKYTYLVNKSLFEADGEYELVISSKDKAFNSAFSDVKGRTITFVIDTTEPVVAVSGLESNGRYKVTEQTVTLVPTDDGGYISKVLVGYADKSGNIYQEIFSLSGEELTKALEEGQGKLSFVIKEGLDKDIKIMCWDSAFDSEGNANVYEKIYSGVSVSTSQMAMLWASDAIRNAIIISVAVIVVGIVAIIVIRKTRKKKNK
ncbi:MAG: Ig-like domain repeat protein [Lachnospiraceae bacterium]|nr:Ig-like domain repeat protein [Lachnospiraceae bacterium]